MVIDKQFRVGTFLGREDVPEFTETRRGIDETTANTVAVGSYTGSFCLSFDMRQRTFYHKSNRTRESVFSVAIPYEDMQALEMLKAAVDGAIEDAKAHNEMREAVRRGAEEASQR